MTLCLRGCSGVPTLDQQKIFSDLVQVFFSYGINYLVLAFFIAILIQGTSL